MGTTILRLDSASAIDGNLHQMDSAEEEWVAYQAGLRIADYLRGDYGSNLSLAPYAVSDASSNANTIGTYTDTFYTGSTGSAPGSPTTTNTPIYQKTGKTILSTDRRYPVEFVSGTPNQLTEMDSSEVDTIAGRLKEYLFDSDNQWAGVMKLGLSGSTPSAEYTQTETTLYGIAFADTIGSSQTPYKFYVKNYVTSGDSASIPTQSRPVSLKRASGLTGTFQGIQEMNDSDIGETFGRAIMSNVMATSNGIGAYQLRSATQGAPTDTGTWKAMGTATDTRRAVVPQVSTRTSQTTRTSLYSADYTRTRSSNYTFDVIGYRSRAYIGNYTRTRTSSFSADYTRTRTSAYSADYTRTSTRTRTSAYSADYTRTSTRTRASSYTRTSTRTDNFTGDFTGDFTGNFSRTYTGNFQGDYARTFVGNFAGNFAGNFTGNYQRSFQRFNDGTIYGTLLQFAADYTRTSTGTSTRTSTRNRNTAYSRTSTNNSVED